MSRDIKDIWVDVPDRKGIRSLEDQHESGDYLRAANEEAADSVWLEVIRQYPHMRFWVARNKTVPVSILQLLADADSKVRSIVTMKNKLTPELLNCCHEITIRVFANGSPGTRITKGSSTAAQH